MTTIKVDFSDVEQEDRTPIRPGKYDVVIENIEVRQAEGKDHPYLNWELSITDGDYEGRKLYMITSLSPKALWNLQSVFQSFGLEDDEVELEADDDEPHMLLSPDLIGEAAIATVRNQLYDGRPQARVVALVGGEGEPAPPKKKAKNNGAAKLKAKAKARQVEEDEEEEEEEEEEEVARPARRSLKTATKAKARPATKRRFR